MRRLLLLVAFLLAGAMPVTATAQSDAKGSFIPGVRISARQQAEIDSIVRAFHTAGRGAAQGGHLSDSARVDLRRALIEAIRERLDDNQRAAFDASFLPAEQQFEAKRRTAPGGV